LRQEDDEFEAIPVQSMFQVILGLMVRHCAQNRRKKNFKKINEWKLMNWELQEK
jgi:hypothetical protein